MKTELLKNVKRMVHKAQKLGAKDGEDLLLDAEKILQDYLKNNPKDTQIWVLLLMIECIPPLLDGERLVGWSKEILAYDKNNIQASFFWAYSDYFLLGNDDQGLYDTLLRMRVDDKKIGSMIELAKARYIQQRDRKKYENYLLKSIQLCDFHVFNWCMLGQLYIVQGKKEKGCFFIQKGLANIVELVTPDSLISYDPLSFQEFLDEFFAGTIMNVVQYQRFKGLLSTQSDRFSK